MTSSFILALCFYLPLFQIDLRDDPKTIAKLNDMKEKPITTEQGQKLAKEVCVSLSVLTEHIFTCTV